MIKRAILTVALAFGLATGASAAGSDGKVEDFAFSFEGPFGKFDQYQLQRGLQIYTEVCSACHGLQYVYFRNLTDEGGPQYTSDQAKAYASEFSIPDEPANRGRYWDVENDDYRALLDSDLFPVNTTQNAPDLSLMAKGRAGFHGPYGSGLSQLFNGMGGPEYIASLLTGYTGETKEQAGTTLYENTAFPGGWISMAPPLDDGWVEFADGHANDLKHLSEDISAFLMWTAEPKMMARKQFGLVAVIFLAALAVLLYLTNKKLWAPIKRKAH